MPLKIYILLGTVLFFIGSENISAQTYEFEMLMHKIRQDFIINLSIDDDLKHFDDKEGKF